MRLEIPVGERSIVLETGQFAKQAGGAVTARLGDSMVLSTATRSATPRLGATFLPLSVDVEERMSSAGKIPGGFIKREGRPSERAILTARLTDRPLRPLFPKGYHYEIQVIGTVVGAGANEVPEDVMVDAMLVAQEAIREQAEAIENWAREFGKEKQEIASEGEENPFLADLRASHLDRVKDAIVSTDRRARRNALDELEAELVEGREAEEAEQI